MAKLNKDHWLPKELTEVAKQKGLSTQKIAEEIGLHPNTVRRILSGQVENATFNNVEQIADLLGYDVELILRPDEETTNESTDQCAKKKKPYFELPANYPPKAMLMRGR